jgi:hypothetical protein
MQRCLMILGLAVAFSALADSAMADRWSRHDGRWYYWSDADTRWYYMDGQNWYYSGDKGWNVYKFDGKFGNDWEIERDELEFDADIEVPRYAVPPAPTPRVRIEVDE